MNIVFICGCLEKGFDGVGDYSRRLAGELVRMGNQVHLISLNDYYVDSELSEIQDADGVNTPAYRLPSKWPRAKAYKAAYAKIKLIVPEWISIQYVPFSFHPKGLPSGLIGELKHMIGRTPTHIMFHELWVGVRGEITLKQKILKQAQQFLIKKMVRQLKPRAITTTIPLYRDALLPLKVGILPLFANIPLTATDKTRPVYTKHSKDDLIIIHFGSFTGAMEDFESQMKYIIAISLMEKRKPKLVTVGNGGHFKQRALQIAKNLLGESSLIEFGILPATEISELFYNADIGISRSDYLMYGKSGSTIAMLEHGLPVILRGNQPECFIVDEGFFSYGSQLMFVNDGAKTLPGKWRDSSNLYNTAKAFINTLNNS